MYTCGMRLCQKYALPMVAAAFACVAFVGVRAADEVADQNQDAAAAKEE